MLHDGLMNEPSFSFLILVIGVLGIGYAVLWIWSLIHCILNRYLTDSNRLIGVILIVILGIVGSFVYLFLPREPEAQR